MILGYLTASLLVALIILGVLKTINQNKLEENMTRKVLNWHLLILIPLFLMLTGCATKLAPSYDKAIVDGLISANTTVMEFFASVSGGTQKDTFDQRKEKYSNLVGRFDALALQAKARPVPNNKIIDKINDFLSKRNVPIPDDSETASVTAMAKISETLVKMRDTDKKQGVTGYEVQAFKNQVTIYLDQALTYESFLER
jgi:hypothetical protein